MNVKIIFSVVIAFTLVFGSLFLVHFNAKNTSDETNNFAAFSKAFDSTQKPIFLLGSSHIGQLNTTLIVETIHKKNENFEVYNLAVNGDTPKKRIDNTDDIIFLEPKIIFYGISFRDFESTAKNDSLNMFYDVKLIIENNIPEEIESINPQLHTRRMIRDSLNNFGLMDTPEYNIRPQNTPFFSLGTLETIISNNDHLERNLLTVLPSPHELHIEITNNKQVEFFKKMIQTFQSKNIKVVIFTTPLHDFYLAEMSDESKIAFNEILDEISNEFDIKIYHFTDKYSGLQIWNNLDHIAYNENSMIFTHDVAEMILLEIDT